MNTTAQPRAQQPVPDLSILDAALEAPCLYEGKLDNCLPVAGNERAFGLFALWCARRQSQDRELQLLNLVEQIVDSEAGHAIHSPPARFELQAAKRAATYDGRASCVSPDPVAGDNAERKAQAAELQRVLVAIHEGLDPYPAGARQTAEAREAVRRVMRERAQSDPDLLELWDRMLPQFWQAQAQQELQQRARGIMHALDADTLEQIARGQVNMGQVYAEVAAEREQAQEAESAPASEAPRP